MSLKYNLYFNKALRMIQAIRNPEADKPDLKDLNWNIIAQSAMFNFSNRDFKEYQQLISLSKKYPLIV